MAWFDIDFPRLIRQTMPPVLYNAQHQSWIEVLLSPLVTLYAEFLTYRTRIIKQLQYNGQVIILENLLNDLFDSTARGIYIDNITFFQDNVFIYQQHEHEPDYIGHQHEEHLLYIYQPDENHSTGYNFIVIVPDGILNPEQKSRLKITVERYKLAGKIPAYRDYSGTPF